MNTISIANGDQNVISLVFCYQPDVSPFSRAKLPILAIIPQNQARTLEVSHRIIIHSQSNRHAFTVKWIFCHKRGLDWITRNFRWDLVFPLVHCVCYFTRSRNFNLFFLGISFGQKRRLDPCFLS